MATRASLAKQQLKAPDEKRPLIANAKMKQPQAAKRYSAQVRLMRTSYGNTIKNP